MEQVRFESPKRCPACGQQCLRDKVFKRHIERCCPDHLSEKYQNKNGLNLLFENETELEAWLVEAREREALLYKQALSIAFHQKDEDNMPKRQGPKEIAAQLGMSETRADKLLKKAMKSIPLAADYEPIEILYEDDFILALNKPAHLITAPKHRFTGGSLLNRVIGNKGFAPHVIHRLDMNTTGVVVFAKDSASACRLHAHFRDKIPRKKYMALALGSPSWETNTVDAPIGNSSIEKVARAVVPDGKPAVTDFKVLATSNVKFKDFKISPCSEEKIKSGDIPESCSLIQCEPQTGRTHQIRVHLAHAGHPIVGDDLYGITGPWIARHALHAAEISFPHPAHGNEVKIEAPLPPDFRKALSDLDCKILTTAPS